MGDAFMAPDIIEQVAAGAGPKKKPPHCGGFELLAEWTGLEPATPGVTGRYSNQLNYHSITHTVRSEIPATSSQSLLQASLKLGVP